MSAATLAPAAATRKARAARPRQFASFRLPFRLAFRLPRRLVRHPWMYAAFLSLSAADVALTLRVLSLDGAEVNPVAARAIVAFGPAVLPLYKLATVGIVLGVCESLARLRPRTGATMACAAVIVMTLPVSYTLLLLATNGPS